MPQQDLERFKFQLKTGSKSSVEVHNGDNSLYGAGAVSIKNGSTIHSNGFTSCTGIISYAVNTGLCTLTRIAGDFEDDSTRDAWVNWMSLDVGIDPANTLVFLVGNKDNIELGRRALTALYSLGLVIPLPIRPESYEFQACDVRCDDTGLHIIYQPVNSSDSNRSIDINWPEPDLVTERLKGTA